jgi:nitroreductase
VEFEEVLESRHSVREFRAEGIPRDILQRVIHAAATSPSAENEQPWTFYLASGKTRADLGSIIAQTTVYLNDYIEVLGPERYDDAVKWFTSFGDAPVLIAIVVPDSENEFQLTNRLLSVGAALENLLLAAAAEGLGACPFTFSYWVRSEMAELLELPDGQSVVSVVAIGWPADAKSRTPRKRDDVAIWLD